MYQETINELESVLGETISLLSSAEEAQFNAVPFEGSWTAAQTGIHLFKSESGMDKLFRTPAPIAERDPDENVEGLKQTLLDFSRKMEAPEFILPEDKHYNKEEVVLLLKELRPEIIEALQNTDLREVPPLPDWNPLKGYTKLELAHFMIYHTQRHNHQIENILKNVSAS
ncbi:DinB family protein [Flavobacterium salilacus subsp. salilacus]|uniref:DinB family protein n=1 Tax=Flavobacterium TaxID=237 RepID=UPI001074B443|nr:MULTISPECIES: DinB family protein [Flavobacterium]KAF2519902.1 DinB family protein [Flavobacterium salilacus subsp. salilacus]MBE1614190.1 DinB family protein [Flavobacterium sp. SaA2.13]